MRQLLLSMAVLVATSLFGCVEPGSSQGAGMMGVSSSAPQNQSSYTCPSCGGRYAQPGNCPKCGLDLVPKNEPAPSNPGNYK